MDSESFKTVKVTVGTSSTPPVRSRWARWFGPRAPKTVELSVARSPASGEPVIFNCPQCRHEMTAAETQAGTMIQCPECNCRVVVPPRAMARKRKRPEPAAAATATDAAAQVAKLGQQNERLSAQLAAARQQLERNASGATDEVRRLKNELSALQEECARLKLSVDGPDPIEAAGRAGAATPRLSATGRFGLACRAICADVLDELALQLARAWQRLVARVGRPRAYLIVALIAACLIVIALNVFGRRPPSVESLGVQPFSYRSQTTPVRP